MSKTRNLSDLLDANGDVKSTALDNVPASNDASALTTGTLDSARLGTVTNFSSTGIDDNATSTAITIDSSQNVLVGTTASTDPATNNVASGIRLADTGRVSASATSTQALNLNRTTDDGDIAIFRKDGTAVGSISANAGNMEIDTTKGAISHAANDIVIYSKDAGHNGLRMHVNGILPTDNTGAIIDNDANLGEGSYRFKDLYLGGNIYLGGTGSANALDDYEEGTWTPTFLNFSGSTQRADYTKIGNLVHIQLYVSSLSSGTGSPAKVQNLPFVCRNNGWASTILQGAYSSSVLIARVQGNSSDIQFKGTNDNDVNGVDIDNSSFFLLQVTYKTDS